MKQVTLPRTLVKDFISSSDFKTSNPQCWFKSLINESSTKSTIYEVGRARLNLHISRPLASNSRQFTAYSCLYAWLYGTAVPIYWQPQLYQFVRSRLYNLLNPNNRPSRTRRRRSAEPRFYCHQQRSLAVLVRVRLNWKVNESMTTTIVPHIPTNVPSLVGNE
ncbi:hypothetical protein J6590_032258 [Homalodisca vitripennis]|nr:hypothetical protein J6590_032258 [Homalodisca vitripennis]